MAIGTKTNPIPVIGKTDNSDKSVAEIMREYGRATGKGGQAKLNAHIFFGAQVKEGKASLDEADQYAKWYDEGACEVDPLRSPMTADSLKVTASNFKGFANPEVLKVEDPYANIAAFMAGKSRKDLGGKDAFAMHVAANSAIKLAAADKKPLTEVTESVLAGKIKGKAKVELTPKQKVDAAKQALIDGAKAIRDEKAISKAQRDAINVMIAALSI